jgi:drug/metabolite transporter (DMT)-like permease
MPEKKNGPKIGRTDLLMLMTVLLWAVNLSVIKIGLRELSPHAFNAIRLVFASAACLALLAFGRGRFKLARGDGWKAVGLGILGITAYQLFFIQGISRMNASPASIVMATSPVFIALLSTALGQERIPWAGWLGIAVSFAGVAFVVAGENGGLVLSGNGARGAAFILLANVCWAGYTVFGKAVLERNSPIALAAVGTATGTLLYLPFSLKDLAAVDWAGISPAGWASLLYSGLVAIFLCFIIWYVSVKEVGSSKTGVYSNLSPIFAIAFAGIFLGERISTVEAIGSAVALAGVYLTRSGYRLFERRRCPAEAAPPDLFD